MSHENNRIANGMDAPGLRGRVYDNIAQTVGNTPLVRLNRLAEKAGTVAQIYAKLEFFNPLASVKDRIATAMIKAAEDSGKLGSESVLVEPTSGNTGIALAFVCAAKGYRLILTMPESMSVERRKMLKLLGAELVLTPAANGMKGAIAKAEEIVSANEHAHMLQQFDNPANPEIHRQTTALEIWEDTAGEVDVFIAGVGTGGTITGVGEVLKAKKPGIQIIAIEPEDSAVLSGGEPGPHKIQGIGAGFKPANLNMDVVDAVMTVSNETAMQTARDAALLDGLPVGISSGAALAAALEVGAKPEMKGKTLVVVCASMAERYLSTDLFANLAD